MIRGQVSKNLPGCQVWIATSIWDLGNPHFTCDHDDFTIFFKYMNSHVMKCTIWIHDHHMNSWSWNHICIIWIQTWIHDHEEYCEIMSGFMCMNSLLVTEFMMLNLCLWNHMKSYYEFIYKFSYEIVWIILWIHGWIFIQLQHVSTSFLSCHYWVDQEALGFPWRNLCCHSLLIVEPDLPPSPDIYNCAQLLF